MSGGEEQALGISELPGGPALDAGEATPVIAARSDARGADTADAELIDRPLIDTEASAICFLYPFTFGGDRLPERVLALESVTRQGARRTLQMWRRRAFSTDDLLSNVARFVDPAPGALTTAAMWHMDEEALSSPGGLGAGARHSGADWRLIVGRDEIPFAIGSVELVLFRSGVGFLALGVAPTSPDLGQWFDFIHHFRFVRGRRAPGVRATRNVGRDAATGEAESIPYFPELSGPGSGEPPATAVHHFGEVIEGLLRDADTGQAGTPWWSEIFVPGTLLPYASLFVDGCSATESGRLLYRLRNFFHATQPLNPTADDLRPDHASLLPYAANQWFFFSVNGGGFLACDAPKVPFFRKTLPAHVKEQYFTMFLLGLHQRFVLMMLSQQVAEEWVGADHDASEVQRVAAFSRIRDAFLTFTAQGYFIQTMQEEHHQRFYERWRRCFQLSELHDAVGSEVREMYEYVDLRQRARAERLAENQDLRSRKVEHSLNLIGWMLGVPVWLFLLLNSTLFIPGVRALVIGPKELVAYDLLIALGLGVIGIGIAYVMYRALSHRSKGADGDANHGMVESHRWQRLRFR